MTKNLDTLVLCVKEKETCTNFSTIDHKIFFLYEPSENLFYLYGKRTSSHVDYPTYTFCAKSKKAIYTFLTTLIDKPNKMDITLYNYKDLPETCSNVKYSHLECSESYVKELVGYDNHIIDKTLICKYLDVLKNIYV